MKVPVYNNSNNKLPEYQNPGDAGCDLRVDFRRRTSNYYVKTRTRF